MRVNWFFTRPIKVGVSVILVTPDKMVLLVRHSYRGELHTPGGNLDKNEIFEDAAKRELKEELNVQVDNLKLFTIKQCFKKFKSQIILIFISELTKEPEINIDEVEIIEAKWYPIDDLPKDTSEATKETVLEYVQRSKDLRNNR